MQPARSLIWVNTPVCSARQRVEPQGQATPLRAAAIAVDLEPADRAFGIVKDMGLVLHVVQGGAPRGLAKGLRQAVRRAGSVTVATRAL